MMGFKTPALPGMVLSVDCKSYSRGHFFCFFWLRSYLFLAQKLQVLIASLIPGVIFFVFFMLLAQKLRQVLDLDTSIPVVLFFNIFFLYLF